VPQAIVPDCTAVEEVVCDLVLIRPKGVSFLIVSDMFTEDVGNLNNALFMADTLSGLNFNYLCQRYHPLRFRSGDWTENRTAAKRFSSLS